MTAKDVVFLGVLFLAVVLSWRAGFRGGVRFSLRGVLLLHAEGVLSDALNAIRGTPGKKL